MTSLPCLTESQEGDLLVAWLRVKGLKHHHSPNETGHTPEMKRRAIRMKRQGTSKGFPDYTVVIPGTGLACIELKRCKGSTTSPEQLEWITSLNSVPGVEARICKGAAESIAFITELLSVSNNLQTGDMF